MPVDPIDEGDAFTAASLNTPFSSLVATVNALPREALRARSLRDVHFSDGIVTDKTLATPVAPTGLVTEHDYYNQYPGYNTDTFSETHSAAPWGTDQWEVVESGVKARKTFTPLTLTMAGSGVAGLYVLANLEVEWLNDPHAQGAISSTQDELFAVAIAIMWKDSTNTWRVLPRTERFYTFPVIEGLDSGTDADYARPFRDLAIRTLIKDADIDTGDGTIKGVQLVVATSAEIGSDPGASSVLECWQFGLTVIPLHATEP